MKMPSPTRCLLSWELLYASASFWQPSVLFRPPLHRVQSSRSISSFNLRLHFFSWWRSVYERSRPGATRGGRLYLNQGPMILLNVSLKIVELFPRRTQRGVTVWGWTECYNQLSCIINRSLYSLKKCENEIREIKIKCDLKGNLYGWTGDEIRRIKWFY